MTDYKLSHNFLPISLIGFIEGLIITMSLHAFISTNHFLAYSPAIICGIAGLGVGILLAFGAYYTRKEELDNSTGEAKILKIYKALDIDENLKQAMTQDTLQENSAWEKEWAEGENATNNLSPAGYAWYIFAGFLAGSIIVVGCAYFVSYSGYYFYTIPLIVLGTAGFIKYWLLQRNPILGFIVIAIAGAACVTGAYYIGTLF